MALLAAGAPLARGGAGDTRPRRRVDRVWDTRRIAALYVAIFGWATRKAEPAAVPFRERTRSLPNIVLIGSDTLRADRLFGAGYRRELTPNLARLAKRGTQFTDCMFRVHGRPKPGQHAHRHLATSAWRARYLRHSRTDAAARPDFAANPEAGRLPFGNRRGLAASDAEKFNFGFDERDLPPDQWNIKFLLRQGPKDLRLFLSLFTQNAFGKALLPEIHFLGGIPLRRKSAATRVG